MNNQSIWLSSPSPTGVFPAAVEMLGKSGMAFGGFIKCLILVIWQVTQTKNLAGTQWQGKVTWENHNPVFHSLIKGVSGEIPAFPANWRNLFAPASVRQVLGGAVWELIYLDTSVSGSENSGADSWNVLVESLAEMCNHTYSLQQEVHLLTNELMLTNQGVLALTEEMELILQEQGQEVSKYGSLLEDKVRTNKELVDRLKEKEFELQQSERLAALGRLVAGVAHEINNPLTFININNELLKRHLAKMVGQDTEQNELGQELQQAVNGIFRGIQRIAAIVKGLKYFSRRERAQKTEVCLHQCIYDAWLLVSSDREKLAESKLICDLPPELKVYGNRQQLEQIMVNLMDNALVAINKAANREGAIQITAVAEPNRGHVIVKVSDNGCGIISTELPKVFQPFYSKGTMGTGLGLSIVQGIVTEHGGNITVSSEVAQGTCFEITLPVNSDNVHQWQGTR